MRITLVMGDHTTANVADINLDHLAVQGDLNGQNAEIISEEEWSSIS